MVEEQIEKLTISVETKTSGENKIRNYRKEVEKLTSATQRQKDLMEEIELLGKHGNANSQNAKQFKKDLDRDIAKMRREYEKYNKTLGDTDKTQKKAAKSASKLADAFVRIVRFKIVAAVLQKTISATKDGIEALSEYDDQFKDTINSYQSSFKQIGGGSALVLYPLLGGLEGMVGLLSDGVGALTNTISALMAGLSGETSYTAVKTFKEINEEIAAADKKAKDLKHTISGFDELNIFSNKNQSETIDIFTTKEIGSLDYVKDVAGMAALAGAAGVVGKAIQALTEKFSKKNKTLEEQTEDTKEDAKETSKLGDVIKSLVPKAGGAVAALGALGALVLTPLLKKEGVTVPAAEAEAALDALGQMSPAPEVNTAPMTSSMAELKNAISSGMDSIISTLDAKFNEIKTSFSDMLSEISAKWSEFKSNIGVSANLPESINVTGGRLRDIVPNASFDLSEYTAGVESSSVKTGLSESELKELVNNGSNVQINKTIGGFGGAAGVALALMGMTSLLNKLSIGRSMGAYASGGIVNSGEFFMARENGIPEFVGSFGSRAGVANNEQIVSGIAGGVESALSA